MNIFNRKKNNRYLLSTFDGSDTVLNNNAKSYTPDKHVEKLTQQLNDLKEMVFYFILFIKN